MNIGDIKSLKIIKRKFFEIGEKIEYTEDETCYLCEIKDVLDANITSNSKVEVNYLVEVLNLKHISKLSY